MRAVVFTGPTLKSSFFTVCGFSRRPSSDVWSPVCPRPGQPPRYHGEFRETGDLPPVWPTAKGRVRGQALAPLHDAAAGAVEGFPALGELLAIVDSLRAGDVRVRSIAGPMLMQALSAQPVSA